MKVDKSKWHRDLLGNLCNIKRGGSPRPIQKFLTDAPDGINWIKIGDAGDSKFISSCKEKIIPEGVSKSRFVHKGDFLLSNSMSFGRPYILNVNGCIHDGWLVLEQPKQFDKSYLYYLLGSAPMYEKFAQKAQGAVVNNLNIDRVASVEIIYPTLDIQQAISAELDAVQAMIDGYKAQIADLDALAQSIFLDMFGDPISNPKRWEKFPLKELAITMSTGPFGSMLHKEDYDIEGEPSINPQDIKDNKISIENIALVNRNKAKELNRYILHTNDIVIARRGDLSKCAIISQNENGWLCGTGSFFLSLKDLMPILFYYFYTSKSVQKYLNDKCIGATMPNLNQGILSSLMLPLPPFALQQHFATQVEAIEMQKELLRQQLADAETLMAERMQYYFS